MKSIVFLVLFFAAGFLHAQNKSTVTLNGELKLFYGLCDKNAPNSPDDLITKKWPEIPAKVPGNVELDLLAAGIIKNPETGNNIYDLRKYEACQRWQRKIYNKKRLNFNKSKNGKRIKIRRQMPLL